MTGYREALTELAGCASGLWQATLDAVPDSLAVLGETGHIVAVNQAWSTFAAENDAAGGVAVGADYLAVCDTADGEDEEVAAAAAGAIRAALAGDPAVHELEYPCHGPGIERWFTARIAPFTSDASRRVLVLHQDVTARVLADRERAAGARLLDVLETAVVATDLSGLVTHWNRGAQRTYGWSPQEVLGRPIAELTVGPDDAALTADIVRAVAEDGTWEGELEVRGRDGRAFPALVHTTLLHDERQTPYGVVGVSMDISDRVATELRLRSTSDFLELVMRTMADGLYVLDEAGRLQFMNDSAEALLGWTTAELEGEVMHDITHHLLPDGRPHPIEECPITRTRTLGGHVRVDSDVFVHRSGRLLPVSYSSQTFVSTTGDRGWVVVFSDITERQERESQLHREIADLKAVAAVRDALRNDDLVLLAQPIVSLSSREVVQHELLLRMRSADGTLIPPGEFVPAAERDGLIRDIDRWAVREAMGYAGAGHAVAVNLSADSLADEDMLAYVEQEMVASGADPSLLVFELTETALMRDEDVAAAFLEGVSRLGCQSALDDFGTGYSGFHYLKRLPVSCLKIDRDFVTDLSTGTADHLVVDAVVRLAQGMGMRTVAEGVEDEDTADLLRALGVEHAQGWWFGRPMPADDVFAARPSKEVGRRR